MSDLRNVRWMTPEELLEIGFARSRVVMVNEAHNGEGRGSADKMSDEMSVATRRSRVKVGATLDPDLVGAIDQYVAAHPGTDRSAVIDEALRLWCARQQEAAMERQFRATRSAREIAEHDGWRRLRTATVRRTLGR